MNMHKDDLKTKFFKLYGVKPEYISRAPGRAEIIGNHTDYNQGFALGAAIQQSCFCLTSSRTDEIIQLYSENFDQTPHKFTFENFNLKNKNHWTNYVKAVFFELSKIKKLNRGFNLYISSSVPYSGGVSSSAALEISIALNLTKLFQINLEPLNLAYLCQQAENSPLVNSPCGFLDQGTSLLATKNNLVFFDFLKSKSLPVSQTRQIPLVLKDVSFVIAYDKKIKRNLGTSGYPARRLLCEQSVPYLAKILNKKVNSLRDINVSEFNIAKNHLNEINPKLRMRVEHIIYENQRVIDTLKALENNDLEKFGSILTASGKSALELYELDEKTPELTFLVNEAVILKDVIGIRNMGGGFSANILAFVKNNYLPNFIEKLTLKYSQKFNSNLEFIPFTPENGAELYES